MKRFYSRYKPGWFVWNPGGSGGSGTVQTDGVTIQGDGSSGNKIALKQVETDATITGAGTVASPLSVVPPTYNFFQYGGIGNNLALPQNQTLISGFLLPYSLTFSKIFFALTTADAGTNSDIGIYTAAGVLVANIGAQHLGTNFGNVIATVQGSQTIAAGLYMFAATTAGNTIVINSSFGTACWVFSSTAGVTAGGALAASITAPTRSVSDLVPLFALSI
jgi:hypothetical protein